MRQLDLQKVLLITNSSVAQSGVDAADYISRRGLNPAHILSFSFGTTNSNINQNLLKTSSTPTTILCTTSGYVGQRFCPAVANYAEANRIEAIILSTHTPSTVNQSNPFITLAAFAGSAIFFNAISFDYPLRYFNIYQTGSTSFYPPNFLNIINLNWYPYDNHFNPYKKIPSGRIGCTSAGNSSLEYIGASGSSIYDSAVTNALVAEQTDQKNSVHVGSTDVNYAPYVTAAQNAENNTWMESDSGLTNVVQGYYGRYTFLSTSITNSQTEIPISNSTYFTTFPGVAQIWGNAGYETISYTGIATSPTRLTGVQRGLNTPSGKYYNSGSPPYNKAFTNGRVTPIEPPVRNQTYYMQPFGYPLLDPAMPPLFSLCVGMALNEPDTDYMKTAISGKIAPGAWGFTWTSYAYKFGQALLYNGGSAAVVSGGEPLASGLPNPGQVFGLTQVYKIPLILANFLALSPDANYSPSSSYYPNATVIGDPLYAPYKSTPLNNTQYEPSGVTASGQVGIFNVWGDVTSTSTPNWATLVPTQTPSWAGLNPNISPDWSNIDTTAEVLITQSAAYIVTETGDFIAAEELNPNWGVLTPNTTPNWTEIN